jgi:hypothetical protein
MFFQVFQRVSEPRFLICDRKVEQRPFGRDDGDFGIFSFFPARVDSLGSVSTQAVPDGVPSMAFLSGAAAVADSDVEQDPTGVKVAVEARYSALRRRYHLTFRMYSIADWREAVIRPLLLKYLDVSRPRRFPDCFAPRVLGSTDELTKVI